MQNPEQSRRVLLKRIALCLGLAVSLGIAVLVVWAGMRVRVNSTAALGSYRAGWSETAAASYLDSREAWWRSWPSAQLSEGTVCLSCHTVVPYALARPGLRTAMGEKQLTAAENQILGSVETRVADWAKLAPYYTDAEHAAPSHATEAVLNAFILALYTREQPRLEPIAGEAFDEAWALQEPSGEDAGGWAWQDFHEAPWESKESAYQGAAMMEVALSMMPPSYVSDPSAAAHIEQLRQYVVGHYAAQPTFNHLYVLWASAGTPGLLSEAQRVDLIARVSKLQRADGGWSLSALDGQAPIKSAAFSLFKRASSGSESDGIATGLTVFAFEKAGIAPTDPTVKRGLAWLESHQFEGGNWWASSMNGFRDPTSDLGRFMSDAATGYAVLAIQQANGTLSAASESKGLPAGDIAPPSGDVTHAVSGEVSPQM